MGVPCVTIRDNTERPITIEMGTNVLAGTTRQGILEACAKAFDQRTALRKRPPLWDGRAAERIWKVLLDSVHPEISDFTPPAAKKSGGCTSSDSDWCDNGYNLLNLHQIYRFWVHLSIGLKMLSSKRFMKLLSSPWR
jgi:hypothetical protein